MQIQNISLHDATREQRVDKIDGPVHVVIRILDHLVENETCVKNHYFEEWPLVAYPQAIVYQFRFNDVDSGIRGIAQDQAEVIFDILKVADFQNQNVIVHCVMGKSRSAGVVEAAIALFENVTCPIKNHYCNVMVKSRIRMAAGF